MEIEKRTLSFLLISEIFKQAKIFKFPPQELFKWDKNNKSIWMFLSSSEIVKCIIYCLRKENTNRVFTYLGHLYMINGKLDNKTLYIQLRTTKSHQFIWEGKSKEEKIAITLLGIKWNLTMINGFQVSISYLPPIPKNPGMFDKIRFSHRIERSDINVQKINTDWDIIITHISQCIKKKISGKHKSSLALSQNLKYQTQAYIAKYNYKSKYWYSKFEEKDYHFT